MRTGPFGWACDASRQVENFTDFGHFAFVHTGLLGDPGNAVVAPHEVSADGHVLTYAYGRPDAPNTDAFPVFARGIRQDSTRRTRYALHLPYTIVEHIDWSRPLVTEGEYWYEIDGIELTADGREIGRRRSLVRGRSLGRPMRPTTS